MNQETRIHHRSTVIILAVCAGLVLIVGYGIWQSLTRSGKTAVSIQKMPRDTLVTVNGARARGSTLYLHPGTYEIKGERTGFEPYTYTITIANNQSNPDPLFFVLTPQSDEAREFVDQHQREYLAIERASQESYQKQSDQLREKYPIIDHLPYRSDFYNIDYYQKDSEFNVQIKSPDALGRQVAIETIKSWGYEPTDYVIEYIGFDNPFANQ